MKVAIYCRVSTEDQHTENQELRLVDYCQRNNHAYEVFNEVESSRKTRPVKAALLDRLRKREYDAVMVYKLDRWGRSTTELLLEIEELHSRGVGFISFSENLDFSTSIGKLQIAILSAFAQFERDLIRQRTMEGLSRAKAQGKTLGRPRKNPPCKNRALVYKENNIQKTDVCLKGGEVPAEGIFIPGTEPPFRHA